MTRSSFASSGEGRGLLEAGTDDEEHVGFFRQGRAKGVHCNARPHSERPTQLAVDLECEEGRDKIDR